MEPDQPRPFVASAAPAAALTALGSRSFHRKLLSRVGYPDRRKPHGFRRRASATSPPSWSSAPRRAKVTHPALHGLEMPGGKTDVLVGSYQQARDREPL